MKKLLLTAIAAGLFFGVAAQSSHAAGTTKDLAKVTCEEFLKDKDMIPLMVMWIDGYMSGKSDNTEISDEWANKLGTHLGTYCGKNPKKTIMDAMDAMPSE